MFDNMTFPHAAIYNVTTEGKIVLAASADVEHQFVQDGLPTIWIQEAQFFDTKTIED